MNGSLLLDTNIILGFLKGEKPVVEYLKVQEDEDMTVRLRRETRRKMPDAIVVASAVVSGAVLVTSDREFSAMDFPDLMTFDPRSYSLEPPA